MPEGARYDSPLAGLCFTGGVRRASSLVLLARAVLTLSPGMYSFEQDSDAGQPIPIENARNLYQRIYSTNTRSPKQDRLVGLSGRLIGSNDLGASWSEIPTAKIEGSALMVHWGRVDPHGYPAYDYIDLRTEVRFRHGSISFECDVVHELWGDAYYGRSVSESRQMLSERSARDPRFLFRVSMGV